MKQFFGKYRGKVANNVDPLQLGRIQVSAPVVLGDSTLGWAMPCVPYAGPEVGFFAIPPVGANVWVEFEGGDPDYPIWSGCFWGAGEVPAQPALAEMKVFQSESLTLTLNDLPGVGGLTLVANPPAVTMPLRLALDAEGITLEANSANIKITSAEIMISNGAAAVKLSPVTVSINDGAFEVM